MALQNRVHPEGTIHRDNSRGTLMGNRGLLHNKNQELVRPFRLKAWIYCTLKHKDWHREVMSPGKYTELFFLDEYTALASGHRPCGLCKRNKFLEFKSLWKKANDCPDYNLKQIDASLHLERLQSEYPRIKIKDLPIGTMVRYNDKILLIQQNKQVRWTFNGYSDKYQLNENELVEVITPLSIVNILVLGFNG